MKVDIYKDQAGEWRWRLVADTLKVDIYKDQAGEWRWRLVARNGEIVATSGEGFSRRWSAKRSARRALGV